MLHESVSSDKSMLKRAKRKKKTRRPAILLGTESTLSVTKGMKTIPNSILRLQAIDILISITTIATLLFLSTNFSQTFIDSHPHMGFIIFPAGFVITFLVAITLSSRRVYARKFFSGTMTEQWMKRWYKLKMIRSVLMLTIASFLVIYRFGVVDIIAAFIRMHWSSASNWMVNAISTIISLTFSGIVGNFAYDMLKRIVLRKKKGEKNDHKI